MFVKCLPTLIFLKLKRTSFVCMFLVTCRIRIRVGKLFYFGSAPQDLVSFFYALSRIWTVPRHCGERLRLPPPLPENTGHQLALQVQKIYSNGAYMSVYSCEKKKNTAFFCLKFKKVKIPLFVVFSGQFSLATGAWRCLSTGPTYLTGPSPCSRGWLGPSTTWMICSSRTGPAFPHLSFKKMLEENHCIVIMFILAN